MAAAEEPEVGKESEDVTMAEGEGDVVEDVPAGAGAGEVEAEAEAEGGAVAEGEGEGERDGGEGPVSHRLPLEDEAEVARAAEEYESVRLARDEMNHRGDWTWDEAKEDLFESAEEQEARRKKAEEELKARQEGPRLMITKLVLENFKSYAGVQEVGPFNKSFTAVVGPNGSGKSNVIDAMLFVFGKRAKQLRLNKVSELIHKSTDYRDLDFCRVSVHFQEIEETEESEAGYEVVPGSSFVVSRFAYKNSTSKYVLGDKTSNFTEVTKFLKDKGIDLDHNRFLILQGEVEAIATMKAKGKDADDTGLLEYLEDIIGSNRFIESIDLADKKTEELSEARTFVLNKVKHAEKERDALAETQDEAELFVAKEGLLLKAKHQLYGALIKEHAGANAGIEEKRMQLLEKKGHEEGKLADAQARLKEIESGYDGLNKEHAELKKGLEKVREQFTSFERQDVKMREERKHAKAALKKAKDAAAKHEKKRAEVVAGAQAAEEAIPSLKQQSAELEAGLEAEEDKLAEMFQSIQGDVAEVRKRLNAKREELVPLVQARGDAKAEVDAKECDYDIVNDRLESAAQALAKTEASLAEAEKTANDSSRVVQAAEDALAKAQAKVAESEAEGQNAQAEEAAAKDALRKAGTEAERLRNALEAVKGKSAVLRGILSAKAKGKLRGIHGRLGDLGSIPDQYDVAVTTAVGSLNHIVTETTEDAQAAVEFLKREKLGVATFLILEKQQHLAKRMGEGKGKGPEGCPRLFDLIEPSKPAFAPAFYFAAGETLVAANLDQANRVSKEGGKRRRVVTLTGQLVEASGTMSGGGKPRKGGMSSKASSADEGAVSDADVKRAQAEVKKAEVAVVSARKRITASAQGLEVAKKKVAELELEVPKRRMAGESARLQAAEIRESLDEFRARAAVSEEDKKTHASLKKALDKAREKFDDASKKAAVLEAACEELNKEIAQCGGERVAEQRKKVADRKQAIEDLNMEAAKAEASLKSAKRALDKTDKDLAKATSEATGLEEKLAAMAVQQTEMEAQALVVKGEYDKAMADLEERTRELEVMQAEHEPLKKVVSVTRKVILELEGQVEDMARIVKENAGKLKHWTTKVAEVKEEFRQLYEDNEQFLVPVDITRPDREGEVSVPVYFAQGVFVDGKELPDAHEPAAKKSDAMEEDGADEGEAMEGVEMEGDEEVEVDVDKLKGDITLLEEALSVMKPNLNALKEYREKTVEYQRKALELKTATEARDEARKEHESLRRQRLAEFMDGFRVITTKVKETYQMITLGGDAELELVDNLDPFSEGILFSVRPPKKSWKNINHLSGGEKTLSSLALVFALHHYKPTPLYVMDEIDAALDFKNVSIVANLIKDRTKNAQFIVISLRNNMFELAERLCGIYKVNNTTKSITIEPSSFVVKGSTKDGNGEYIDLDADKENNAAVGTVA